MKKIKKNNESAVPSRNPAGTQPGIKELSLEKLQLVAGGSDDMGTWGEYPRWASPPPVSNH